MYPNVKIKTNLPPLGAIEILIRSSIDKHDYISLGTVRIIRCESKSDTMFLFPKYDSKNAYRSWKNHH